MKRCTVTVVCIALAAVTACTEEKKTDMDTLRGRLVAEQIAEHRRDDDSLARLVKTQQDDGTWGDIDYETRQRTGWKAADHVARLTHLARAFAHPKSRLQGEKKVLAAIRDGLAAWVRMDPQSSNWWHNQIGVPTKVAAILLLTGEKLPNDLRGGAMKILARSRECKHRTGQNLVWVSRVTLAEGVLRGKPDLVRTAVGDILSTVKVTGKEGIQADASFHQHGSQLYSGGYGRGFLHDATATVAIVRGTKFAATDEQVQLLTRLLLDGHQWMIYRGFFDPGARGREISRRGSDLSGRGVLGPAGTVRKLSDDRAAELEKFALRLEKCKPFRRPAEEKGVSPLVGNRHFWCSDFMVHRGRDRQYAGDWYMSVKMHSTRTLATESGNGEALKNWYMGCGTMTVMNDRQNFKDIWPLLDWRKLPGTTVEQSGKPLPEPTWTGGTRGKHEFVGGVSDGVYGAAAYTHDRDGVKAYKAWFFVDDLAICLGAGIEADGNAPVVTTIDQAYLHGEPAYGTPDAAETLKEPYAIPDDTKWVTNGRVGYLLLEEGSLTLDISKKSGKWQEINRSAPAAWEESAEVMTLAIDHGVKPDGAKYAYVVYPSTTPREMVKAADRDRDGVYVVSNTPEHQAVVVEKAGVIGAVLRKSGLLEVSCKIAVSVDKPCLVLLTPSGKSAMKLSVSDPTGKLEKVTVGFRGPVSAEGATYVRKKNMTMIPFDLPTGLKAGKTVSKDLTESNQEK